MHSELSSTRFTVAHEGVTLQGRELLRDHRRLAVQLIHPYGLLCCTLHMPSFMVATGATLLGPAGDARRAHVLRLLYADAQRFHALLPGLLHALPPGDERTIAFMEGMDAQLVQAHSGRPELDALPWNHPVRFRREVQWLRHHGEWPAEGRLSLVHEDPELEWQLLLLLHHALHRRFAVAESWGNWAGN